MSRNAYEEYYLNQAGSGLPVFVGSRHMKGHGIGNVLSGLVRMAVPILKKTGKAVLREGVRTGIGILDDVTRGANIKKSLKNRAQQSGNRLIQNAVSQFKTARSPGRPRRKVIKRRLPTKSTQLSTKRRRVRNEDIFT